MAGTVDPLQVQAPGRLLFVDPMESSLPVPLVKEQDWPLAQLTASSLSPDDSAVSGSSAPSMPRN